MVLTDRFTSSSSPMVDNEEDTFTLSRRRAAALIFFVGVVVLSLLFLIRLDVDIKRGQIGERANIIEKTTPVFEDPVYTAINGVNQRLITNDAEKENLYHPKRVAAHEHQRDPRLLSISLFRSMNGRQEKK